MIKVHINPGEEVMEIVSKIITEKGWKDGMITLIGAVDDCCISTMPKHDAKKDILVEYHEPLELSGNGEIRDGKPHIHAVIGREGNITISGHLHWAKVKEWYVNVFITLYK